ncbi:hypothetical protein DPMN_083657 [Dreissena polymorpha]|uniref:Uncharacterized protein n=1 Tax=Dreissena polymorpha TaxID=45954 RepID=A0A9D3YAA4_DREPO|nr:hypothetical protein DPMN_083657 [Dreissena polymorpha]
MSSYFRNLHVEPLSLCVQHIRSIHTTGVAHVAPKHIADRKCHQTTLENAVDTILYFVSVLIYLAFGKYPICPDFVPRKMMSIDNGRIGVTDSDTIVIDGRGVRIIKHVRLTGM